MSNNFTSGMAGPLAVETLNLLWDRVTEQIVGNSTTSLAIGTGTKTLTIEASKQFALGQTARITYNTDVGQWMQGTVSAYNATTGELTVVVDAVGGSGTYAAWTVALNGPIGATGPEPSGFLRYQGIATPATTPTATTDYFYIATTPGTYTNFGGLTVGNEIAHLIYNGSAWGKTTVYNFNNPQVVPGEVVSGALYSAYGDAGTNTVLLKAASGTKVRLHAAQGYQTIDIPVQSLSLDVATYVGPSCKLYCSMSGTLAMTTSSSPNLPAGQWVLLGLQNNWEIGKWGGYFPVAPIVPSNHYFYGWQDNLSISPSAVREIHFARLGGLADGVTDNVLFFNLLISLVSAFRQADGVTTTQTKYRVIFPAGTILSSGTSGSNFHYCEFVGAGKLLTIIKPTTAALSHWNFFDVKDMTLHNIACEGWSSPDAFVMKRVRHLLDAGVTNGGLYSCKPGTKDYEVTDCDFDYLGDVYIALYISAYRSVLIERNTFNGAGTGYASHIIRIDGPAVDKQNVVVRHNKLTGGTTGIFFGSNRVRPITNVLVELNDLRGQIEESISFDGFGNNAGLCPVICNGLITSVSNDAAGRLVVVADMKWHDGTTPNTSYPVSSLADWTPFYFSLDEGSGREGTTARIVSTNSGTNAYTLELRTPAASINVGGWCGVQSGFFDCVVRNNTIVGSVGNGPNYNYATALSIYLNVFNFTIDGNTVVGCANGINLAGGLMLSTYRTLAYNNVVKNNRFLSCNERAGDAVVRFDSYYGTIKQYGNQFINNVIQGGLVGVYMRHQANLIYENNVVDHVDACDWKYCANTLPTADATQIGRTFMKITDDGSGNPTTIEYYVCKLASGTYSWVAV